MWIGFEVLPGLFPIDFMLPGSLNKASITTVKLHFVPHFRQRLEGIAILPGHNNTAGIAKRRKRRFATCREIQ